MKFNFFRLFLFSSIVVFISSCLKTTDATAISTDATFVSLSLAKNDSVKRAVFTLVDSTIVNLDSLPFGTKVDAVYPTFNFTSSSQKVLFIPTGSTIDTIYLTGTDTINFTNPVKIRNYATNLDSCKNYTVKVNVHQVEPKLYVWSKLDVTIDNQNATSQKALIFNDKIYFFLNNGNESYLYTSFDGYSWSASTTVNGLPNNVTFGDITLFAGKLYLTQNDDMIYTSTNGVDWTVKSIPDYNFKSLLFGLNGKIWAVAQSQTTTKKYFANSTDGVNWAVVTTDTIPKNFPVNNFTSLSFASRTGKPKAIVVAAKSENGDALKSWSTEDGKYWVNFGKENKTLDTLAVGFSIIPYDDKLFLFGQRTDTQAPHFKISKDEGLSWQLPDTIYNRLRQTIKKVINSKDTTLYVNYQPHNYQSVVVLNPKTYNTGDSKAIIQGSNRIFMIGGKSGSTVFSDVWTGKLNRKNFLRQ